MSVKKPKKIVLGHHGHFGTGGCGGLPSAWRHRFGKQLFSTTTGLLTTTNKGVPNFESMKTSAFSTDATINRFTTVFLESVLGPLPDTPDGVCASLQFPK